jgi:AcrR family transcriptional regulator
MPNEEIPRPEAKGLRREPLQQRSQASLDRLLDVTEELLKERRFESILVADIVRRAKSSVGVFYSRFQDKADVLFALMDRENRRSIDAAEHFVDIRSLDGIPIGEIVRRGIRVLIRNYRERRHVLAPIIGLYMSQPDRYLFDNPFKERVRQIALALAEARGHELRHPDPSMATRLTIGFLTSFLEHLTVFDSVGFCGLHLDDPGLEDELYRMAQKYLGMEDVPNG